jgi:hypothetical protein
MPRINIAPLFLKDVVLAVGADSYEKHVSGVTLTPSTSPSTFKGLSPDAVFTEVPTATWMLSLEYAQDWETPDSLSAYLFNNQGNTVEMTFTPRNGSGPSFAVSVVVLSGAIGGQIDSFATTTVSLPLQGQPELVAAV